MGTTRTSQGGKKEDLSSFEGHYNREKLPVKAVGWVESSEPTRSKLAERGCVASEKRGKESETTAAVLFSLAGGRLMDQPFDPILKTLTDLSPSDWLPLAKRRR